MSIHCIYLSIYSHVIVLVIAVDDCPGEDAMIDHIDRKEVEYWSKKMLRDAGLVTPRRRTNACYD